MHHIVKNFSGKIYFRTNLTAVLGKIKVKIFYN